MGPQPNKDSARDRWVDQQMAQFEETLAKARVASEPKLTRFLMSLAQEGERSAVVLGAERVHVAIETLLKRYLLPSPNSDDKLFSSDGALGTFSRKTDVAYRLGLIDMEFKQAVDLVRSLRNAFAHAVEVEKLSDKKHANRVDALVKMLTKSKANDSEVYVFLPVFAHFPKDCQKYLACIMVLLIELDMAQAFVKHPEIRLCARANYPAA